MLLPKVFPTASSSDSKIAALFLRARSHAHVNKRVETSLLVKLLKDVHNTTEDLSTNDLDTIKEHRDYLFQILNKQNSKSSSKKFKLIVDAYCGAEQKLSHDEKNEKHKAIYEKTIEKLDVLISVTDKKARDLTRDIDSIIDKLPDNAKENAKKIIEIYSLEEFHASSDMTKTLFPPTTTFVPEIPTIPTSDNESSGKMMPVNQSHPNIQEWISLGPLVKEQLKFNADLMTLIHLKNQSERFLSVPTSQQESVDYLLWESNVSDIDKRYNSDSF